MSPNRFVIFALAAPFVAGCLKTRAELRGEGGDPAPQRQMIVAQRSPPAQRPPPPPQYNEDAFEQLRNISGRLDVLENHVAQNNAAKKSDEDVVTRTKKELEQKFVAYEEALKKLETQVAGLTEEVQKMREDLAKKNDKPEKIEKGKKADPRSYFQDGESLIAQKKWREAILSFEKYRSAAPKGKSYADATYKIGVCMQEVGMRDEAKLFYDEVIGKFPGSKEAKKAAYRLKTLK